MSKQTDITHIVDDFVACLDSVGLTDEGAAVEDDAGADGISTEEETQKAILSAGQIDSESKSAAGDNIETHTTTARQGSAEGASSEDHSLEEEPADEANRDTVGEGALPNSDEVASPASADASYIFDGFPNAPFKRGEFKVPLCDLVIGDSSPGGVYNFDDGTGETLLHAVQKPEAIAPLVVTKANDKWHVLDGWARVMAMRFHFGNTANILVRVIEWDGTRNDALYERFAATFLTLRSRKVDKSILLREFHLAWAVPQLVLAARIGWAESRVTRNLAAAETMLEAPRFAALHVKAGDPPIDYLYGIQQARDAAAADDAKHPKRARERGAVAKLEARLEALLAKPERFATEEALAKLGLEKSVKAKATSAKGEPTGVPAAMPAPEVIDCVEDSGGEAIAMVELGADQLPSIRLLVDMTTLEDHRKAEVRHILHDAMDRLLGF